MGLFRKVTAAILGSSQEELVKAKKEVAYTYHKSIHSKEARDLESHVKSRYEDALEKILYIIGNSLRHHAGLRNADYVKNSTFLEKFVDVIAYEVFVNGTSLGHQMEAGTADAKYQEEIAIILDGVHRDMMNEANSVFRSKKVTECFSAAFKVAADAGVEAGSQLYRQGYILMEK